MERLGLPAIKGYRRRGNIQLALIDEVTRQTHGGATLLQAEASSPVPPAIAPARFVERPVPADRAPRVAGAARLQTRDYGALAEENRRLGKTGEQVVVDLEVARLTEGGRPDLAALVTWVARDLGDGAGYDVGSFELDGRDLHIEVKTTRQGPDTPFYLSAWELAFALDHHDSACIYRVHDLGRDTKVYVVRPPYEQELVLEPVSYRARP